MRLIVARHGETQENKKRIIQGQSNDGHLSKNGWKQVAALARRLRRVKIDVIYSSDMGRAADTARAIVLFHPHAKVKFTAALRERNCGQYEGKRMPRNWRTNFEKYEHEKGMETNKMLYTRAKRFLTRLEKQHDSKTVLLVGHSAIDRALVCVLQKKMPTDIRSIKRMKNASLTIAEKKGKNPWRVVAYNDARHVV